MIGAASDIDTLYDFDRVRRGELLHPLAGTKAGGDPNPCAFAWGPAGEGVAVVGYITTKRGLALSADVSVWALRDGECFYAYDTVTRRVAQCTMWWRLDDGSWHTARYINDRLQSCGADSGPPPAPALQNLVCNGGAGLAAPPEPQVREVSEVSEVSELADSQ